MPTLSVLLREGEILPKVFATTTALRASEIMLEQQCSAGKSNKLIMFATVFEQIYTHKMPSCCL